jgi:GNAT superfamily N-acetyltransferase
LSSAQIRPGDSSDHDAIAELYAQLDAVHRAADEERFRSPDGHARPADYVESLLASEISRLFVAVDGQQIVGLAVVHLREILDHPVFEQRQYALLDDLVVRDTHRRRGLGSQLVRHAERWARERGAREIELAVWSFNEPARRLYEALGYAPFAIRLRRGL